MDYPLHPAEALVRPWRMAALIGAVVASVELVLLIVVGGALLAKPEPRGAHAAKKKPARVAPAAATPKPRPKQPAAVAELKRTNVEVLVLNGNGRQGAAAVTAQRISQRGYRIGGVANAPRMDYTRSLVMYRKGFEGEGVRLARDLGIRIVGPLDGLRARQLHGAHTVVVVGA